MTVKIGAIKVSVSVRTSRLSVYVINLFHLHLGSTREVREWHVIVQVIRNCKKFNPANGKISL